MQEDLKAALDAMIARENALTYFQVIWLILLSGVAVYFGNYLRMKGRNLATKEDIRVLTEKVEEAKLPFLQQLEDYKAQIAVRAQAAKVAEFLNEWLSEPEDTTKLNGFAMELSLWLPAELYKMMGERICLNEGAPSVKEILIEVRKFLLKDSAGDLAANHIIHFPRNKVGLNSTSSGPTSEENEHFSTRA